ncbi:hypothetical protein QUF58_05595 [Anaerolineales bacterium HSG24]|nr:hypothetical protein [Anaerolineales bacterium HSG24]
MNAEKELKKARQNLYRTMTMDGIADISIGMIFISLGGFVYIDSYGALFIAIIAMLAPLTAILRKKIVDPRIGSYDADSFLQEYDVDPRFTYFGIAFLILGVAVGLMVALGVSIPAFIGDGALIIVGLLVAIAISMFGSYTGIKRLYLYATTLLVLFIHGALQNYPTADGMDIVRKALGAHILIFGATILLSGTVICYKFLQEYPIAENSENEIS